LKQKKKKQKKQKKTDNANTSNLQALFLIDSWFLSTPKDSSTSPESHLNSNKSADEESDVSRIMPHMWVGGHW
jgi:hypothetical protein